MANEKERFLDRITQSTHKTLDEINQIVNESNLTKHSEIRTYLMDKLNLTYGDANTLTHYALKTDGVSMAEGKSFEVILSEIYSDKKSELLVIHTAIMNYVNSFGDFEIIPKKGYLSLKCKRQFMMIGPKTNTRLEIGINIKDELNNELFIPQPKGSMCQYIVRLSSVEEVNEEIINVLKLAYHQSK